MAAGEGLTVARAATMAAYAPLRDIVDKGLAKTLTEVSAKHGYVDAVAGVATGAGAFAKVEAGYRFAENLAAFGEAGWTSTDGAGAGLGLRWKF